MEVGWSEGTMEEEEEEAATDWVQFRVQPTFRR